MRTSVLVRGVALALPLVLAAAARADVAPDPIKWPPAPRASKVTPPPVPPVSVPAKPAPMPPAAPTATVSARAAFDRLKTLAGTWEGHVMTPDGPPGTVTYRVAS